jgi:hypothetical protein
VIPFLRYGLRGTVALRLAVNQAVCGGIRKPHHLGVLSLAVAIMFY